MLTDEQRACIAWRCEHPKTGEDHRMVEISLGTLRTLLSAHDDAVRLRNALADAHENDWTASLCDRLNEIVRENTDDFTHEVKHGMDASGMIRVLHGLFNGYKASARAALRPAEQGGGA